MQRILVTGAAGFIGSNFVHHSLRTDPERRVIALDKLGYAGSLENLDGVEAPESLEFVEGDVCDEALVAKLVGEVEGVVHFAAESMVDRSVLDPMPFGRSNFLGTLTMLEAARQYGVKRFLHISTPEVYGERLGAAVPEESTFGPRNIYSACKAGAEMLVSAYLKSFQVPIVITRGSNAIGPRQHPEKVVPLWITSALQDRPLLMYGDGAAVRDWIHVDDLNAANDLVFQRGEIGAAYNVVSGEERSLRDVAEFLLAELDKPESLITPVGERPGHDLRYHMDPGRIHELGWQPQHDFASTFRETVRWYVGAKPWWQGILATDDYKDYIERNFRDKLGTTG